MSTNQMQHQLPEVGVVDTFSPDGRQIACPGGIGVGSGYQFNVTIWEITTKQRTEFAPRPERNLMVVGLTPNGRTMVSAANDGSIRFWDVPRRVKIYTITGVPLVDDLVARLGNEFNSFTTVCVRTTLVGRPRGTRRSYRSSTPAARV